MPRLIVNKIHANKSQLTYDGHKRTLKCYMP